MNFLISRYFSRIFLFLYEFTGIYFELKKIKLICISRADVAHTKNVSPRCVRVCVRTCVLVCARVPMCVISEIKHSFQSLRYLTNYT